MRFYNSNVWGTLSRIEVSTSHKTLFNHKAGSTPQDTIVSIITLVIILCFESKRCLLLFHAHKAPIFSWAEDLLVVEKSATIRSNISRVLTQTNQNSNLIRLASSYFAFLEKSLNYFSCLLPFTGNILSWT